MTHSAVGSRMTANDDDMRGACYACAYRRSLPGNAHSSCWHPATARAHQDRLAPVIERIGQALPLRPIPGLEVVGDPHGVRNGLFSHPYNFDPAWLVSCDGFEAVR